jgi:AcrR family transcriptional regulator
VSTARARRPGRPATIDRTMLLAAAIDIIDESGIGSCTIRLLADRVGVTPMSVYRHVADKPTLIALIPDTLLGLVAADVMRRRKAVPALRAVADGLGGVLDEHPNLAPLFHQPVPGPHMIDAGQHCARLLVDEGYPQSDSFEVVRSLVALVVGQAVTSHGRRRSVGVDVFLLGVDSALKGRT